MVTIKADNGYEILARDCSIISYGRGPDLFPDRKVSADTSRAMLLVRESEKQEE